MCICDWCKKIAIKMCKRSVSYTRASLRWCREYPKITKGLIIALLAALMLLFLSASLWTLCIGKKDILDVLSLFIQLLLMVATLCVVGANVLLVKANNDMAKSAEEEISLLKRQFASSNAPIMHNIKVEYDNNSYSTSKCWHLQYENITPNPAMRVTVFGKENGNYLRSNNTEIILGKASGEFYMDRAIISESMIKQKIETTYARNIEKIYDEKGCFAQYFSDDFSGFLILYQGIDGRLHASCLRGQFMSSGEDIYGEKKRMDDLDQSFYPFMQLYEDESPIL